MTTKVIGATDKPVSVDKVAPREDDKPKQAMQAMQAGEDTAEAKASTPAKQKAARKQFKKADEAATPEQQAEARLSLAVRGY